MKISFLLIAILLVSVIASLMSSRAMKTGALVAVAILSAFGLLRMHGILH